LAEKVSDMILAIKKECETQNILNQNRYSIFMNVSKKLCPIYI